MTAIKIDPKNFDDKYFERYETDGKKSRDYTKVFKDYVATSETIAPLCAALKVVPERVLDLGCATGALMQELKDNLPGVREVHGIEIAPWALERATLDTVYPGSIFDAPRILQEQAALTPDKFSEQRYDLVIGNLFMYLTPDQVDEFCDMVVGSLLKPNGLLLLRTYFGPVDGPMIYAGDGVSQHVSDPAAVIARPRRWWEEKISFNKAGYSRLRQIGDLGGGNMVFTPQTGNRDSAFRPRPMLVAADYDVPKRWAGKTMPVRLTLPEFAAANRYMIFAVNEENNAWEEIESNLELDLASNWIAAASFARYIHNGELHFRTVTFKPRKDYWFVPGCFSLETDEGWVLSTDWDYEATPGS